MSASLLPLGNNIQPTRPSSRTTSVDVNASSENSNTGAPRNGTSSPSSPTGVNDESLFLLENSKTDREPNNDDQSPFLSIVPVEKIRQQVVESYIFAQHFVQEQQQNFVLDRKTITTMILSFLASMIGFIGVALVSLGGIVVVSCPLWLPVVLLTLPLWLPLMIFTSPVWLSVTATLFFCLAGACAFVLSIAFFFVWPEEWLPGKESSVIVAWFLHHRDAATIGIAKIQAKILLYAAGVGPAADAVFVILDRLDVQALVTKLKQVDWEDLGAKVKGGQVQDIQRVLFEIARSMFH